MLDLQTFLKSFDGFTPGAWELRGRTVFPKEETALCIAVVEQHRKECAANARLIAAAPNLLALAIKLDAALRFAAGAISTMPQFSDKHPQHALDWIMAEFEKASAHA